MNTESWAPPEELVEALYPQVTGGGASGALHIEPVTRAHVLRTILAAAVEWRTPEGPPAVVPWERVAALVEAAEDADEWLHYLLATNAPDWTPGEQERLSLVVAALCRALAAWDQENP